jgi:hypothetical protein
MEFMKNITIRGRVAFYLAIAQKLFEELENNDDGYLYANEALNQCWFWLNGKDLTGDELCEYLENENDTGLMVFSSNVQDNPVKEPIWIVIITALMYTIWQAYQLKHEKYLPESIEQVDENAIDYLIEYAHKCQSFNEVWIELLRKYLLENHKTDNANEYGNPIMKSDIMMVVGGV